VQVKKKKKRKKNYFEIAGVHLQPLTHEASQTSNHHILGYNLQDNTMTEAELVQQQLAETTSRCSIDIIFSSYLE